MKKLFLLSAAALAITVTPAVADHHKDGPRKHDYFFKKMDADGDGVVTEQEFLDHSKERFNSMDLDKDKRITKEEATQAYEKMREKVKEMRAEKKAKGEKPVTEDTAE